jgi:hypothetical protein
VFPTPAWRRRLDAVIAHANWFDDRVNGRPLVQALRALAKRADDYADELKQN